MSPINYNTSNTPENQPAAPIQERLRLVGLADMLINPAADSVPDDTTGREMYQPQHPAVPAASEQAVGRVVNLTAYRQTEEQARNTTQESQQTVSQTLSNRHEVPVMPLPVYRNQEEMAQAAREKLNAVA